MSFTPKEQKPAAPQSSTQASRDGATPELDQHEQLTEEKALPENVATTDKPAGAAAPNDGAGNSAQAKINLPQDTRPKVQVPPDKRPKIKLPEDTRPKVKVPEDTRPKVNIPMLTPELFRKQNPTGNKPEEGEHADPDQAEMTPPEEMQAETNETTEQAARQSGEEELAGVQEGEFAEQPKQADEKAQVDEIPGEGENAEESTEGNEPERVEETMDLAAHKPEDAENPTADQKPEQQQEGLKQGEEQEQGENPAGVEEEQAMALETDVSETDAGEPSKPEETPAAGQAAIAEPVFTLEQLETTHQETVAGYRASTQKRLRLLQNQSNTALKSCDATYHDQLKTVDKAYDQAISKVKKSLGNTMDEMAKGKTARKKKLGQLIEAKMKRAGHLTWNKQEQAEAMGREFAIKTWTYTNDLKEQSGKKAYQQKQEIKKNGADALRKYTKHKYYADVREAVGESVSDYCESINEATADLKTTLNEDAGEMAANFKTEATDLKALLPQGKNQVKQNILNIGMEGAKQFAAVDKDILPALRKNMYAAEKQLHQERKKALVELRQLWQQSRQGIQQQQTALQHELQNSEKQAVKESRQVMDEVRAEVKQNPQASAQLAALNGAMQLSPGELAQAQDKLLAQGAKERNRGLKLANKGMKALAGGAATQASGMAGTATKGAGQMLKGALKGYDQVVSGTAKAIDDELSRYEKALDKTLTDARADWRKKLGEGKWGMRKKAHEVWYENGKLRKESRSELFAVAKDASEVDFWDVLQAIGYFLAGVLAVVALILLVVVVIWAIGALLAYLGAALMAVIGETLVGAFLASLGTLIEAGVVWLLQSTVFWVAASAYGVYSGVKTINEAKNNPNLTRNQAAFEYGFGTGEIITSIIPFWGRFKSGFKNNRNVVDSEAMNPTFSENLNYTKRYSRSENTLNLKSEQQIINSAAEIGDGTRIPYNQLTARQKRLLKELNRPGAIHKLKKSEVSMNDLKQLTNHTGDEFNMFTLGSRRTIIRGKGNEIKAPNQEFLDDLYAGKYGKFSGHTHPPGSTIDPGPADRPFLKKMNQYRSGIWGNTVDEPYVFGQNGLVDDKIIQNEIRSQKMAKYYSNFGL